MRKMRFTLLALSLIAILFSSCRSEFERIRSSGDINQLYSKALEYYEAEEYDRAQTLFELVIGAYRGRKEAEEIYFKYAYTFYNTGRYILAAYYFKNFSNTYTTSDYREEADFMHAECYYQLSPSYRLDQSSSQKAIDAFQLFVNTYPQSDRVATCNKMMDELRAKLEKKAFSVAELYFDLRQYQSAMHEYENVLKDFPETRDTERIRYMIIRAGYELAKNSVVDKQEERYREVTKLSEEFISRYNSSTFVEEVRDYLEESKIQLNKVTNVGYQNQGARNRS
ncbi:MAG: outer membrane protein assembly factor BamD [Bacteroidota bacterium]